MRWPTLGSSFALLLAACGAPSASPDADGSAPPPNVVLVMADDLGWGDVAYQGHDLVRTPSLDAMATAGMRFDRFYSAAPVCSPTRGSALTGRHPYRYGITGANKGHLPEDEVHLAVLLREQGYRTGHFGKWHLGTLTTTEKDSNRGGPRGAEHYAPPWERGFDVCFSTEAKVPTWDPMVDPETGGAYGTAYWTGPGERAAENLDGDDSRVIMDRVVPFVRRAAASATPFFAVVWFHTPHLPVIAGPKYEALYDGLPEDLRHYLGAITAMDEQIGRLRAELSARGVAENTMLFFCSDNGPEGNASAPGSTGGLRGRKRSLHEGGIRVPALWVWPGHVPAGSSTAHAAVTSDYLPTVLDALGLAMPMGSIRDGISLLPLLEDQGLERPAPIGFQSGKQVALIEQRWKLIRTKKPPAAEADPHAGFQLYDVAADPAEGNDVAAEHPEIVARIAARLEAWRESCRAEETGR